MSAARESRATTPMTMAARRAEAPDRRTGGVWTRRQTLKNWLIACVVRGAFSAADLLPPRALLALGRCLGRAARLASAGARRLARQHAARCLAAEDARQAARACFERAGENLATCLLLRRPSVKALDWVEIPQGDRDTLVQALSGGRGAVFVSAHLGPFELLVAAVSELGFRPAIVVRESYDARLDAWIDAHRLSRGIEVIHRGRPGAATRIVRALRAGQPVGLLPDLGGRVPQIPAVFLGQAAGFPVGPARIAQRLGAPIVVGTLHPVGRGPGDLGRRFALTMARVDSTGPLPEVTQRIATVLERSILNAPEDYPWMASPLSSREASTSRDGEEALDLSTTCRSKGGLTWGSEAPQA